MLPSGRHPWSASRASALPAPLRLRALDPTPHADPARPNTVLPFPVTTGRYVEEFREGYQWPAPSTFDHAAAVQRYELNVDPADLVDVLKEYQPLPGPTYINIKTQLAELLDSSTTRRRKTAVQSEVAKKVERHGPGGEQFCEYVAKFVDLLGQVTPAYSTTPTRGGPKHAKGFLFAKGTTLWV